LFFVYALVEPFLVEVKRYDIESPDIPESLKGMRIAFITDIHHTEIYPRDRVRDLVEKVNGLKPDIILLGGDYVNKSPKFIEPCFEELAQLEAPYGKFGVLGNHDHWESATLTKICMDKAGIKRLDNKSEWINKDGQRIKIGGVGDIWEDKQELDKTIFDVEEKDFVILLSHNPDYAERIKTTKIDLVLSGHTHGGQVTLFGLWAPFIPSGYGEKYKTGIIKTDYTEVLVSNGVGYVGYLPVRFFARPQIVVVELK
jgi:predicted MPP superfamily phosphohydrolase